MSSNRNARAGFTIIELLVAMGIISLLAALLVPAVQTVRASARRTACVNQLRQMGLALHLYYDSHACFPPGSYLMGPSFPTQSGWGWGAMILPSLDQGALYERIDFKIGTAVGNNLALINTTLPVWRCPAEVGPDSVHVVPLERPEFDLPTGNYCGSEGILGPMSCIRMQAIRDGASRTLLLGERLVQFGVDDTLPYSSAWCGHVAFADGYEYRSVPHLRPNQFHPINNAEDDPRCFGSRHAGGANFIFADGAGKFLNDSMDARVFEALGTINGGETVELP